MIVNESGLPRKKLAAYVACLIHSELNQLELRFSLSMIWVRLSKSYFETMKGGRVEVWHSQQNKQQKTKSSLIRTQRTQRKKPK